MKKRVVRYRDKNGRFTKFDGRKLLRAEITSAKGKRTLSDLQKGSFFNQSPEPQDLRPIEASSKIKYTQTLSFGDRKGEQDLYTYLHKKGLNRKLKKILKDNPNKVLAGRIRVTLGNRRLQKDGEIKLSHLIEQDRFISGKRKGRQYTPKDVVASFIHELLNNHNFSLYKRGSDEDRQVRSKGDGKKYEKNQLFEIDIRTVSKTASKTLFTVKKRSNKKRKGKRNTGKAKRTK